jgi:hypothetical protein
LALGLELSSEEREELLRRCWYSHDARWYMAVSAELGPEAANRLNRKACHALGSAEMRRFVGALGIARPTTVQELVDVIEAAFRFFAPPPLSQFQIRLVDEHSYEIRMERCFIHENVTKAGLDSVYTCAVLDRIQGWHEALGIPMARNPSSDLCLKVQGRDCRLLVATELQSA